MVGFEIFDGAMARLNDLVIFKTAAKHLGSVNDLIPNIGQSFSQDPLGMTPSIFLSGIESSDACIKGSPNSFGGFSIIYTCPHPFASLPGTHNDRRNF
jgi:hypothetical protein